jgi:competence protein CoiA
MMPFRCLTPDGDNLHAFDLDGQTWSELREQNKQLRHLRMPCCDASVLMKTSPLGLNFFAHKSRGTCDTALETEEHLLLKSLAVEAALKAGWSCATEVRDVSPNGEVWTADVLATKGEHRMAIEVQCSPQTPEETLRRQKRYRQSGVWCLWLFRRPGFPISKELPAVFVWGDTQRGFEARIPHKGWQNKRGLDDPKHWRQVMSIASFLDAAFERRFRYGIDAEVSATVNVRSSTLWCRRCRAETRIITSIEMTIGPYSCQRTLVDLPDQAVSKVVQQLPPDEPVGFIKPRFRPALGHTRLSNGCLKCDALIDEHFDSQAWSSDPKILAAFPVALSDGWRQIMGVHAGWGVHP